MASECKFKQGDKVASLNNPDYKGVVTKVEKIFPMSLRIGNVQGSTWRVWVLEFGQEISVPMDHNVLAFID